MEQPYKFNSYIVFKMKNDDPEECAKIMKIIDNKYYEIKQNVDGLTVQGTIEFSNIIRKASFKDLENLKGTNLYKALNPLKRNNIFGFESNLIRHA